MALTPRSRHVASVFFIGALALGACNPGTGSQRPGVSEQKPASKETHTMALQIQSPAFAAGQEIPTKFTCDGEDVSPPLQWSGIPGDAKSLALICDDPAAPSGTWVHWVMYGIAPTVVQLAPGVPATDSIPGGARQGLNDFKRTGYGGPCPPPGNPHRYFFKLYALDMQPSLDARATKQDLERAMAGHILAQAELIGTYQRKK